jgi:hypothetical protein
MDKTARISYYPILATKTGDREFSYKGKPNRPNLVVSDYVETTPYIATKLILGDDGISIVHEPTTNYHRNITVRLNGISLEELDELELGESKEIVINAYIRKEPQQLHPTFRRTANGDEIVFPYTKPIADTVIEGVCNREKEEATDKTLKDLQDQYGKLLDMLNSLKGSGTVNTTYQYMAPDGDMSCQLMEDTNTEDINVFRQSIYEDKTIQDNETRNKKLSEAATAMSIGMFGVIAIVLMGILLVSVYFIIKSKTESDKTTDGAPIDEATKSFKIYRALDWTFILLYIIGFGLLFGADAVNIAGIVILCITFIVMMSLIIIQRPNMKDVMRPILPTSMFARMFG